MPSWLWPRLRKGNTPTHSPSLWHEKWNGCRTDFDFKSPWTIDSVGSGGHESILGGDGGVTNPAEIGAKTIARCARNGRVHAGNPYVTLCAGMQENLSYNNVPAIEWDPSTLITEIDFLTHHWTRGRGRKSRLLSLPTTLFAKIRE